MEERFKILLNEKTRSGISSTRLLGWVQEDEKARFGISSTRPLGCKKTRRRDPASRQLDFLVPTRREDEIRQLVNSTPWVSAEEKARSGISPTRLPGSKKTRKRDPASRQLDFLGAKRREGEIRHFVNSTSWVQKDEKTRSGISSTRLLGLVQEDEKARFGISSTRPLGCKKTRRRDPASRQLDFLGPTRREDEIRQLVNSTPWVSEEEKARSGISSTRLPGSKKTRNRDPASRQLDSLGSRREKARSGISSTRLPGFKKTRRRDPASRQLDFLVGSKKTRRRDSASRQLDLLGAKRREGEIRHLVNSTSWVQQGEKTRSGNSSTRLLGSQKKRRRDPASRQLDFLGPRRQEIEIRHLVNSTSCVQEGEKASF